MESLLEAVETGVRPGAQNQQRQQDAEGSGSDSDGSEAKDEVPSKLAGTAASAFGGKLGKLGGGGGFASAVIKSDPDRKSIVLSQWTGLVQETRHEATTDPTGLAKPTAVKVNKTLRRWQKRAMYGQPERAGSLPLDSKFKAWYIEQRDTHRVSIPEPLLGALYAEAIELLAVTKAKYEKVLGPHDDLVRLSKERIAKLQNYVDNNAKPPAEDTSSPPPRPRRTSMGIA